MKNILCASQGKTYAIFYVNFDKAKMDNNIIPKPKTNQNNHCELVQLQMQRHPTIPLFVVYFPIPNVWRNKERIGFSGGESCQQFETVNLKSVKGRECKSIPQN